MLKIVEKWEEIEPRVVGKVELEMGDGVRGKAVAGRTRTEGTVRGRL